VHAAGSTADSELNCLPEHQDRATYLHLNSRPRSFKHMADQQPRDQVSSSKHVTWSKVGGNSEESVSGRENSAESNRLDVKRHDTLKVSKLKRESGMAQESEKLMRVDSKDITEPLKSKMGDKKKTNSMQQKPLLEPILPSPLRASMVAPLYNKLSSIEMASLRQAFRVALNALPKDLAEDESTGDTSKRKKAEFSEEAHISLATQRMFKAFAKKGKDDSGKHANSMDLEEFLLLLETIKFLPNAISKRAAISLFKEVNAMRAGDYDGHEFSQFEFCRAMEILAKRLGFNEVADLFFTPEQRRRIFGSSHVSTNDDNPTNLSLSDVSSLGDLRLEHMRALLRLFKDLTIETALEPELPMDVFVKAFQPVLKLPENEIALLFMKIDVNSDGTSRLASVTSCVCVWRCRV
jgi:hypothetical protein